MSLENKLKKDIRELDEYSSEHERKSMQKRLACERAEIDKIMERTLEDEKN